MNRLQRMKLLEDRLNRLERNPRDNYGVRQKIKREIESIRKANGVYDVTGRISGKNFHEATQREISFMKKNYIPRFDVKNLEGYLLEKLK